VFRRAIITDEVSQEPEEAIRLAQRFGLDGIEVRSVWNRGPHELSRADVSRLRAMAGDAGLAVAAVATPCFKCSLDDPGQTRSHFEMLRRCLEVCGELGTTIARIFTFWRPEEHAAGPDWATHGTWAGLAARIADHLTRAVEIAGSFGCRLGVENEPSVFGSNGRRVADVLARAGHPALGALWDPGNDVYDPEGEQPYPEGYLALSPYLLHVHIKDARRNPATGSVQAVPLGDGEVPYSSIFARLVEDGYAGFVSLETHYRIAGPLSAEAARLPGGAAFSAGGLEASELCLRRWEAMLAALERAAVRERRT